MREIAFVRRIRWNQVVVTLMIPSAKFPTDQPVVLHNSVRTCVFAGCIFSSEDSGIPGPLPVISGGQSPYARKGLKCKQGTHTRTRTHKCKDGV